MKKRILGVIIVAVVAITAGWNFNQSENDVMLSDLALANVDALASGEDGETRYQSMGYCSPSEMNYKCVTRQTAEKCRRHCP